jgi:hypothetical protein
LFTIKIPQNKFIYKEIIFKIVLPLSLSFCSLRILKSIQAVIHMPNYTKGNKKVFAEKFGPLFQVVFPSIVPVTTKILGKENPGVDFLQFR